MQRALLPHLACPDCGAPLRAVPETEEIEEGELVCKACSHTYPIVRGVPRLVVRLPERSTAPAFGRQWNAYSYLHPIYRQQFLDWIQPIESGFFAGKLILDAGCGKGRHLAHAAAFGARMVVGVDLSDSVEVARHYCRGNPRLEVVQADIMRLPFRPGTFDYAYSIGVLHHLSDPRGGFQEVVRRVRPGGHVSIWVYGKENNEWIERWITPLRLGVMSRLPFPVLQVCSKLGALFLWLVTRGLYRPLSAAAPWLPLPYRDYLMYISDFPFMEMESIVLDHLHPDIACYLAREEVDAWLEGLEGARVEWHNRNSWRGFARVPEGAVQQPPGPVEVPTERTPP